MGLKRVGRVGLGFKMEEKREYELDPHMRSLGSPICGHAGHSWVGIRVWLLFPINRFIFASSSFSDFPWCRISTPIVEPWWRSPSARLPNLSLFLLCHFDSVILLQDFRFFPFLFSNLGIYISTNFWIKTLLLLIFEILSWFFGSVGEFWTQICWFLGCDDVGFVFLMGVGLWIMVSVWKC